MKVMRFVLMYKIIPFFVRLWFLCRCVLGKVKCLVLRIPNEKTLSRCFGDSFTTTPNPVKRTKLIRQHECFGLNAEELKDLIEDNDRQRKEVSSSIDCLNKAVKEMEYKRAVNEERPKFKCKCSKDEKITE